MIILYLVVLGLAIILFMILGGRNRRRKNQKEFPPTQATTRPEQGRAPGED
jgi:hypothetical protein